MCYQTCPKCGSTSILRSFSVFGESIGSTCGFRGGKAIIIIARDIVGRCLSAYAQVTFQGYKRKEKLLKAQRNKYALLDPRNPIERLSLFIDAYKNLDRRKDILDIYHAYPMMHFYSNLLFCPKHSKEPPELFILDLTNLGDELKAVALGNELKAVARTLNISLGVVKHSVRHSGTIRDRKKRNCAKCQVQYAARAVHPTLSQRTYRQDKICLQQVEVLTPE